jgi:hypothetical protein
MVRSYYGYRRAEPRPIKNAILVVRAIQTIVIIATLSGCTGSRYVATTESDLTIMAQHDPAKLHERHVVVPDDLAGTYQFLKEHDYKGLLAFLEKSSEGEGNNFRLSWALYYFFTGQHGRSTEILKGLEKGQYRCQVVLLLADNQYELASRQGGQGGQQLSSEPRGQAVTSSVLPMYQQAFDCSNQSYWKQLVHMRLKYARYRQ